MELHFAPFAAGVLAGANGTMVGHPFDTLKTRFQVGRVLKQNVDVLFIRQLYRGILPPLLTSGAIQSVNFFLFENFRTRLRRQESSLVSGDLTSIFVAGSMSGSAVSLVSNPISIVKIRQQVESSSGVRQCVRDIYASSGMKGFYRGYSTMLALDASRGLYLTIYEVMKRAIVSTNKWLCQECAVSGVIASSHTLSNSSSMNARTGSSVDARIAATSPTIISNPTNEASTVLSSSEYFTENATSTRMLGAALTGMLSWCIIFPIDVVRVRLHLDFACAKYSTWQDCARKTYAEGGARMFYRGLGYTLVRAGPVSAASLTTYEYTKDWLESIESAM
jgi:solute carrier family 25 carnitine/acylcarnitine transporter 20/29